MLNHNSIRSGRKKAPLNIEERKLYVMRDIDEAASHIRSKLVIPVFGQEALYAEKSEEAIDYTSSGYPDDLSSYPLINAEVNATGKPAKEIVKSIIEKKAEWISFNAKIEEIRLRGKAAIKSKEVNSIVEIDNIKNQTIKLLNAIEI